MGQITDYGLTLDIAREIAQFPPSASSTIQLLFWWDNFSNLLFQSN